MSELQDLIDRAWTDEIVPTLQRYIEIPNVSPAYAADWAEQPYMEQAERDAFVARHARLLELIRSKIEQQGQDAVVFSYDDPTSQPAGS